MLQISFCNLYVILLKTSKATRNFPPSSGHEVADRYQIPRMTSQLCSIDILSILPNVIHILSPMATLSLGSEGGVLIIGLVSQLTDTFLHLCVNKDLVLHGSRCSTRRISDRDRLMSPFCSVLGLDTRQSTPLSHRMHELVCLTEGTVVFLQAVGGRGKVKNISLFW